MLVYDYEAVDNRGRKISAEVEATDTQDAIRKIHIMGYFPTKVTERVIAPRDGAKDVPGGAQT